MTTADCIKLETRALYDNMICTMNDHIGAMDFDSKLDYLNAIADEAERLIQATWDEELVDEDTN